MKKNNAAVALRSIKSKKRSEVSRKNGKNGGRPKSVSEKKIKELISFMHSKEKQYRDSGEADKALGFHVTAYMLEGLLNQ